MKHRKGNSLHDLADYAVVQINDNSPINGYPTDDRLLFEREYPGAVRNELYRS